MKLIIFIATAPKHIL